MEDSVKKYFSSIESVLYTYIIRIICAIGIFGNVAILVVLSRRGVKETAFVYVRALAAVDLVICTFLLGLGFVRCGDCTFSSQHWYYGRVFEAFLYLPFANAGQMANLFLTIAMAIHRVVSMVQMRHSSERYVFRINIKKSRQTAKRLVIVIVIFSACVNVIRFFFYTITVIEQPRGQVILARVGNLTTTVSPLELLITPSMSLLELLPTPLLDSVVITAGMTLTTDVPAVTDLTVSPVAHSCNFNISSNYVSYGLNKTAFHKSVDKSFLRALTVLHIGELIILTTVNVILICVLRRSKRQRKTLMTTELQHRRTHRDDVTRLLVIIVLVHVVSHFPSLFSGEETTTIIFGSEYTTTEAYRVQIALNNTLTLTSHAVTFFLYLVSWKFRKQVTRTFYCILRELRLTRRSFRQETPNNSWTPSINVRSGTSPILARHQSTYSTIPSIRYL